METDSRIGVTFTVPPSPHAGHTVTVEEKDRVAKHNAYWLRCECGAMTTIGTGHLDALIAGRAEFPWDMQLSPGRVGKVIASPGHSVKVKP